MGNRGVANGTQRSASNSLLPRDREYFQGVSTLIILEEVLANTKAEIKAVKPRCETILGNPNTAEMASSAVSTAQGDATKFRKAVVFRTIPILHTTRHRI
jgi:hypothetical protein